MYKGGKTYVTKRTKDLKKSLSSKDIESLLWIVLSDTFSDMEGGQPPRYGRTMLTFAIQQLSVMHGRRISKGWEDKVDSPVADILSKWLAESAKAVGEEVAAPPLGEEE